MKNAKTETSPNSPVGEGVVFQTGTLSANGVENQNDFSLQNSKWKSDLKPLIRHLVRETNRLKLDYSQLKYVFAQVRELCEVSVPNTSGRKLFELPTTEELSRFYEAITNPIHTLFFETLECTGLRVSEICALEVVRLDLKNNQAFIFEGKGKKDRIAIIPDALAQKLKIYLDGKNNRYLFESNRNTKYTKRRIDQICADYRAKVEITKKLTPHTFRHVWNTRLAEAGITKEKRAIFAGHSSEKTQEVYTHLGIGGMKQEILAILNKR